MKKLHRAQKPHIRLIGGTWRCEWNGVIAFGNTPREAYFRWVGPWLGGQAS
jgi:hypothetical protein